MDPPAGLASPRVLRTGLAAAARGDLPFRRVSAGHCSHAALPGGSDDPAVRAPRDRERGVLPGVPQRALRPGRGRADHQEPEPLPDRLAGAAVRLLGPGRARRLAGAPGGDRAPRRRAAAGRRHAPLPPGPLRHPLRHVGPAAPGLRPGLRHRHPPGRGRRGHHLGAAAPRGGPAGGAARRDDAHGAGQARGLQVSALQRGRGPGDPRRHEGAPRRRDGAGERAPLPGVPGRGTSREPGGHLQRPRSDDGGLRHDLGAGLPEDRRVHLGADRAGAEPARQPGDPRRVPASDPALPRRGGLPSRHGGLPAGHGRAGARPAHPRRPRRVSRGGPAAPAGRSGAGRARLDAGLSPRARGADERVLRRGHALVLRRGQGRRRPGRRRLRPPLRRALAPPGRARARAGVRGAGDPLRARRGQGGARGLLRRRPRAERGSAPRRLAPGHGGERRRGEAGPEARGGGGARRRGEALAPAGGHDGLRPHGPAGAPPGAGRALLWLQGIRHAGLPAAAR
mmetsp:Transcript_101137/g.294498  ORF Transcript_101137/g.294498 Transcript_101137/m.294498 type:complete len:510 (+) Transcript_101137:601-2130(+)